MKVPREIKQRSRSFGWIGLAGTIGLVGFIAAPIVHAAGPDTDQLIKYYRKKANVPPQADVTVTGLKDSAIKGAKEGTLQVGTPPNVRSMGFTMSSDGRYVVFGETEDLTIDPFKKVMEKISLKGKGVHSKGPDDAKVTIVEYSDFQCPFCSRGYSTIENEVLKEYGDKVRFVYKHFPLNFHPWAELGSIATECVAEQNPKAFWPAYSYLFENQKDMSPQNVKEKVIAAVPADMKIDKKKFDDCYDNKKTAEKVRADMAEGQSVGVTGTPAFLINGRLISGAQPAQVFKNIIDDELGAK